MKAIFIVFLNSFLTSFFGATLIYTLTHFNSSEDYSFLSKLIVVSVVIILFFLMGRIENLHFLNFTNLMIILFYPFFFLAKLSFMFFSCFYQLHQIILVSQILLEMIIFILLSVFIFVLPYFAIWIGQKKNKNYLKV